MSRLEAFVASSLIALSGCATAAQPKVEQKVVIRDLNAEWRLGESLCDYMHRNGIRDSDPSACMKDKEFEVYLANISRGVAEVVAGGYCAENEWYVRECLHVQQYDTTTEKQRRGKCAEEVLDIFDADPDFQNIGTEMQEMVREDLRRCIMERQ